MSDRESGEREAPHRTSLPLWPCFALAAFVLIEVRVFVDTPSLRNALQAVPNEQTTRYVSDRASDLFIGGGVTIFGLACAGVFFAGLARRARAAAEDSIAPGLIVIGGAATVAAGTGAALFSILADAASSDRAPTTVAAVYTIFDSLAYIGFTAMGLVTAGVAVASFREHAFSRAVGWLSAIGTGLFVVCCGMRKFGRTSQNIRFAGKTELTHPIALRRAF